MSSPEAARYTRGDVVVEKLSVAGPAGPLETVVEIPASAAQAIGVICHPHPLYGGTMDNKVVVTLARALSSIGIPALRFNFRGVGASAGQYDEGRGEIDDAAAVVAWAQQRWPGRKLVLCGFSFGAYVALRLAQRLPVAHLVSIAPAVGRFDFSDIRAPEGSWLLVQGDADDVVDPAAVLRWAESLKPAPRVVVMAGAGHFFHGRLTELRDAVIEEIDPERLSQFNRSESS